ncbi:MAG: thiol-disulfide oxidoreductase DCC family protein [Ferruginibacter sp.]
MSMSTHPIILFDGICNLCNSSVQFVIKHDPGAMYKFASLQSEPGQKLLRQFNLATNDFNSFVLIQGSVAYTKSTAALKVAKQLKGAITLLYGFIIVPAFIRDAIYKFISRNRYKWFGKRDECMIPTPALKERFLN